MKKSILAACIALNFGVFSAGSFAQTLSVNGKVVANTDVTQFHYVRSTNTLEITTSGGEFLVVQTGTDPGPGPVDPGPVDPDPVDPDPVDPGPGDPIPVDPGIPSGVDMEPKSWLTSSAGRAAFYVRKGQIHSTKWVATTAPALQGTLKFYAPIVSPSMSLWISTTPGGEPLSANCKRARLSKVFSLDWGQGSMGFPWYCILTPGETYYINIQSEDVKQADVYVERTF